MQYLNPAQAEAIKKFWAKAKPKGWHFAKEVDILRDETLKITMLDSGGHKHWLLVTADGKTCFAPTVMVFK